MLNFRLPSANQFVARKDVTAARIVITLVIRRKTVAFTLPKTKTKTKTTMNLHSGDV